nr:hypothetical protein [Tanacetum cinerariifolium]
MVTCLSKSDASEGFHQIIDFLNGSSIKYALTVNPNIYVSCIKQFWTTVAVMKVNDVIRLQALVDRKKVVVTEATIREALHLDDVKGVESLPNEEIFTELARMAYEKPSTKLTFYKAFFSSQWNFLIYTILQCMSAKRTSWNEFSSSMASVVICLSSGRKFNFSKRVCKGFSKVETPLLKGMLVAQEVAEGDDKEHDDGVPAAGDTAEGDVSAAHDEVPTIAEEPSIPSLTPPTLPPQPSQDIPSTSQAQPTPPQSPQVQPQSPQPQPQPQQDAGIPINLFQKVMDTCTALSRKVKHLELDKISQALEITKLKRRVKKLERRNKVKVLKLRRLQKVRTTQRVETSNETVMYDVSNQERMISEIDQDADVVLEDDKEVVDDNKEVADDVKTDQDAKVDESAQDQGRQAESQAEIYKIDLEHANKVLSMQEDEYEPAEVQEVLDVVTTAKIITEVVTAASETITAASTNITAAEAQVPAVTRTVAPDEAIDHVKKKAKEDPAVKRYQVLKRKPQTEAQKRKEQIKKEESRVLKRLNETLAEKAAKRQKLDEEVEELKRHLQIVPNEDDDVYTEATSLSRKVPIVCYEIIEQNNKTYYKIIRADGKIFYNKAKNFSDDFLLITLGAMFEKSDIHAQIWKNQRSVHGPAKVKGWKLLESCGVQIITFTTTQLILLVERKYP